MAGHYRVDYFDVILDTKCHVCGHSFLEFPNNDCSVYQCPKCDQLYKVRVAVRMVSKIDTLRHRRGNTDAPDIYRA